MIVSLSAREEDLLVSDRQMRALSARLKGEARASGEAAARAEAVADELRTALEEAAAAEGGGDAIRGKVGDPPEREGGGGVADRCVSGLTIQWCAGVSVDFLCDFLGVVPGVKGGGRGDSLLSVSSLCLPGGFVCVEEI